jgi:bifunctional non-homologous end joining protein LigD
MPRKATPGGREIPPPYKPQRARVVERPPDGGEWLHETRYEGYRVGCLINESDVRLIRGDGRDVSDAFPEIVLAARALAVRSALIDGVIAVLTPDGRTNLERLEKASEGGSRRALVYFVFDLIHVSGETLTARPLVERKAELLRLIGGTQSGARIRYSDHVAGRGPEFFEEACRMNLGGVVSKRADSPYESGPGDRWRNANCVYPPTSVSDSSTSTPVARAAGRPVVAGIGISNPARVMFPDAGISKLDVARFYERIAHWILPHVKGRPLTLVRCPKGAAADCYYMKHSKVWAPSALRRVRITEKKKVGEYLIADTVEALVALIQMDVLEIHTWNTRYERVELPDRLVFDIDPGDRVSWAEVIAAGKFVRKVLRRVGLESFAKTTGGRGLHVVVPLTPHPEADWKVCLEFSRAIAESIERHDPELYTTTFAKAGRERKLLIDYLRNNRTNTSVAAFSTRARPGATVSMPLGWRELRSTNPPETWTILTAEKRLENMKSDPWAEYWSTRQSLVTAMRSVRPVREAHAAAGPRPPRAAR